jgi:Ca-activated chloride channel family protein
VLPRRPGWRSHVPILALLLAAGALVVAAAKPQKSVAVVVDRASIILATDVSGSMLATDIAPDRLTAAKRAGRAFVAKVPARVNIGVMAFNQVPSLLQSPTTDRTAVTEAIAQMKVSGGTAAGEAVLAALRSLAAMKSATGQRPPAAIVLLSDGATTKGRNPVAAARRAGRAHVPIYTVALGTPQGTITVKRKGGGTQVQHVPPDPTTLAAMAKASGGQSFTVADPARLSQVYERLGKQLGRVHEQRQVTVYFAGGGLLMLLFAIGTSLRWFGRPI